VKESVKPLVSLFVKLVFSCDCHFVLLKKNGTMDGI